MSNQLVKKNPAEGYQNVFPKTFIDAIKDKESGVSLQEILQGFNMYFLSYNGSRALTRCKVPSVLRKEGLWITYVLYDHTVVTEWYNSDQIDDNSWSMDSNWRVASNSLVGNVSVSADGYWVINGEKTEAKAQGEQGVTPLLRIGANNKLQVSYNAGKAWRDISDYIVPRFRYTRGTTNDTAGIIQISMDLGKTWANLSNEITNNLRISRYIGINESLPTFEVAEGTVYMKGPYYDEGDTSNANPIYRMWVYAWKGDTLAWQDNGEFTSISAGVVQETGDSETEVMSQRAVTNKFIELESEVKEDISSIYGDSIEYGYMNNNSDLGGGLRGLNQSIVTDLEVSKVIVNGSGSVNFYEMSKNKDGHFTIIQDLGLYTLYGVTTLNVQWKLNAGSYIVWGVTGSGIGYQIGSSKSGLSFGSSINNIPSEDSLEWDVKIYGIIVGFKKIESEITKINQTLTPIEKEVITKVVEKPGINIVNPDTIKHGYGLGSNFQEYNLGDDFCISNYIKVDGKNICANSFNRAGYASFVVYDENYNPLRAIENNNQYNYQSGDFYIRITFNYSGNSKKLYANYGDTLLPYEPYFSLDGYTENFVNSINQFVYEVGNPRTPTAYKTGIIQAACALYIVPNNGILETIEVYCNSDSCIDLVTYTRNTGDSWNVETYLATIKCVKGLNKIQIDSPVKKGHYIGFNITDATSSIGYTTDGASGELGSGALKLKGKYITMNGTANNYCIKCTIKADEISKGVQQLHHSTTLIDSAYNTVDNFISSGFNGFDATQNNALVYFNKKSWLDKYVHHVEFTLNKPEDTKIVLCQPSGDARNSGGYYVSLDTSTKKLSIHSYWNGNTIAEPSVLKSVNIPFVIGSSNTYVLDVIVDSVKTLTARFTNRFTQKYVEVSDITTGDSHNHGNGVYCGVLLKYGHINIKRFKISADCPVRPTLTIYGDSFCQGYNMLRGGEDMNKRYPQLIKDYLNGDVSIICKGGRTSEDMEEIMDSDMNLIVGKYTLLAIGLNNNIVSSMNLDDFRVSMSKLINKVRRLGSEPILVTYPRMGTSELSEQYNSWITSYIPVKYLDVREATAVDKEGAYGHYDPALFYADAHPNIEGNKRIFNRFIIDFGDMKSDNL